jgi:hypothetical protein
VANNSQQAGKSSQSRPPYRPGVNKPPNDQGSLRSLTRLLVGGLTLGAVGLRQKMQEWEQVTSNQIIDSQLSDPPPSPGESNDPQPVKPYIPETPALKTRYAAIGALFTLEESLKSGSQAVGRAGNNLARAASPLTDRLNSSPLVRPFSSRYEKLVARGEKEVNRWIALGRAEDRRSQEMAKVAFDDTNDMYLGYMATNPEVQDLITLQSTGMANEIVEEVRERTVSADMLLEALARSLLRRPPRSTLPPPPPEVQKKVKSAAQTRESDRF